MMGVGSAIGVGLVWGFQKVTPSRTPHTHEKTPLLRGFSESPLRDSNPGPLPYHGDFCLQPPLTGANASTLKSLHIPSFRRVLYALQQAALSPGLSIGVGLVWGVSPSKQGG